MWCYLTDVERGKFRYFLHKQNIRDCVALLLLLGIIPITVLEARRLCSQFQLTEYFPYSELVLITLFILFCCWVINIFSSTTHGLFIRFILRYKRSKYCYATMYGKVVYTGVHNRSFYNLQRYTFIRDIDDKIFRRKRIYFVDTDCAKDSTRLIILKARRGFTYYGVCI